MSGNDGKGNISLRDSWRTPDWIFAPLHKQYGFEFDCCSSIGNNKCLTYSSDFESVEKVEGIAWMNPPFSIAYIMFEHFFKTVKKGIAIYRCDNLETGVWQRIIFSKANWIFIPDRRVNYEGLEGEGARFPSALIGIGVEAPKNITGTLLRIGIL